MTMNTCYYKERPEIAEIVPAAAQHVLDVGCGAGQLGALLKRTRPAISVWGIEPERAPAEQARKHLNDVYVGFAGEELPSNWPTPDCVVFADCLEHMPDPWSVLTHVVRSTQSGTTVVVSLPNVAHLSVVAGLLTARWDYADQGPLDRTHLRFFTRSTAVALIEQAGLSIELLRRVRSFPGPKLIRSALKLVLTPFFDLEQSRGVPRIGSNFLDFFTYQYLLVARKP